MLDDYDKNMLPVVRLYHLEIKNAFHILKHFAFCRRENGNFRAEIFRVLCAFAARFCGFSKKAALVSLPSSVRAASLIRNDR
jgi:hypothetical protein